MSEVTPDPRWEQICALARRLEPPQWHAFVAFWDALIAEGKVPYPEAEIDGWGDLQLTWQGPGWIGGAAFAPGGESVMIVAILGGGTKHVFVSAAAGVSVLRPLLLALAERELPGVRQ